jgi:hypothetical protein
MADGRPARGENVTVADALGGGVPVDREAPKPIAAKATATPM